MPLFSKIIMVSMLTMGLASAGKSQVKYTSAGYNAHAYFQFDGCPNFGSYLDLGTYASQTKFKATGKNGFMETSSYDEFYLNFHSSSCEDNTYTYQYGNVYSFEDYGDSVPAKFTVETKKLSECSFKGLEVPVYEGACSYECTEVCYAEIFEYGTCPPEEPYLECYTVECGDEELAGIATVDVVWKVPTGTTSSTEQSSSMYRSRSDGSAYMSRSKGSYRFDIPVSLTAKLNGKNLFSSAASYKYGELASTTSKDVSKFSNFI